MHKTEIRNLCIERRNDLSPRQVRLKSAKIITRIKSLVDWPIIRSIHIYQSVSLWNEIETDELIQYIGKAWPHIEIVVGDARKRAELPTRTFDVIIVPLLAFDDKCHRIGFGGGWYDQFLANQASASKVGVAYHCQRVANLPVEPHDITMDVIVTERRIIRR